MIIDRKDDAGDSGEATETVVGAGCYDGAGLAGVAAACGFGPGVQNIQVLGAPRTTLTASSDTTVTITVSLRGGCTFIGRKLLLPAQWAASVRIKSLWCDATPILPTDDPLAGEMCSTANPDAPDLPFVPVGQNSTIRVVFTEEAGAAVNATFGIMGVVTDAPAGLCGVADDPAYQALAARHGFGPAAKCRPTVIGSPATAISSATGTGVDTTVSITVSLRGGSWFIGRRLILPKELALNVSVKEVWCDATPILASNDPIGGQVFATDAQIVPRPELPFVPVKQNSTIRVVITNHTGAAITTAIALEGVIVG